MKVGKICIRLQSIMIRKNSEEVIEYDVFNSLRHRNAIGNQVCQRYSDRQNLWFQLWNTLVFRSETPIIRDF
jgi:hypothetical protein